MNHTLEKAYEQCRLITRQHARNFYFAFITLPASKRKAIYAAYAFCRFCDDAVDQQSTIETKMATLKALKTRLTSMHTSSFLTPASLEDYVFQALADTATKFNIPHEHFEEVIRGTEMDLTQNRYETFLELQTYCYRVASVVGLICLQIFGYSSSLAREHAIDLGIAMQLTNIIRDIKEDIAIDRVYIPQDEIDYFGYSVAELENHVTNEAFQQLMAFQAFKAREYFQKGLHLLPLLSPRTRACPAILAGLYVRILDRIQSNNFNVFDGKVKLSVWEKITITMRTWLTSMFRNVRPM